jgi:uncharacterized protein (DUF305 family)
MPDDRRPGLPWPKAVAACLVFAFAGFGIGTWVQRDRPPAHNEVDIGFLRDMMVHHEQAIEMSVLALRRVTSGDVRQEALDIILSQRSEYVQMRERLRAYGVAPQTDDGSVMGWMGRPMPATEMPGLATAAQMDELRDSSGVASDRVFLELMTVHHAAGVEMARYAIDNGRDTYAMGLAGGMVLAQEQEIADMAKFARALGFELTVPVPTHSAAGHGGHGTGSSTG